MVLQDMQDTKNLSNKQNDLDLVEANFTNKLDWH